MGRGARAEGAQVALPEATVAVHKDVVPSLTVTVSPATPVPVISGMLIVGWPDRL